MCRGRSIFLPWCIWGVWAWWRCVIGRRGYVIVHECVETEGHEADDDTGSAVRIPIAHIVEAHAQHFHAPVFQRLFRCLGALRSHFLLPAQSMASRQFPVRDGAECQDELAATVAGDGNVDDSKLGE